MATGLLRGAWPKSKQMEHKLPPNYSKPGKVKMGCKAFHVMHSKYLVKINERAKHAKLPLDIHKE